MQNGHAVATVDAPVSSTWSVRAALTRVPARLLHPHPAAARAAAERLAAAVLHLDQLDARDRAEDVARRGDHAVVARQVARVVVGDRLPAARRPERQPAVRDEARQELAVMADRERAAQLAVLVADRVEAVGARRDDRPLPHPVAVERLDVLAGEDLEHVLVAHPAGRVAGARLLLAEDGERDARGVEAGDHGPGDPPVAVVERGRAADPVQDLEGVELARRPGRPRRCGTGNGRPFAQSSRADGGWPHGLATLSMPLNAPVSSCGKRESSRTRLRRRPTILSTCSIVTGHASTQAPQVRQSQTASYGIAVSTSGRATAAALSVSSRPAARTVGELGMSGRPASASTASWRMPMMNVLGLSGLPGVPGRARLLAAAALGAGEPVEQVLPAQVGDGPDAERRVLRLEVHRRQLAARRELAQRDVGDRGRDVQVLAERQVAQEHRDEHDVRPPEDREQRLDDGRVRAGVRDRAAQRRCSTNAPVDRAVAPRPRTPGRGPRSGRRPDQQQDVERVRG